MDDLVRNSVPAQMTEHLGVVVNEMVRKAIERRIRAGVEREVRPADPYLWAEHFCLYNSGLNSWTVLHRDQT